MRILKESEYPINHTSQSACGVVIYHDDKLLEAQAELTQSETLKAVGAFIRTHQLCIEGKQPAYFRVYLSDVDDLDRGKFPKVRS